MTGLRIKLRAGRGEEDQTVRDTGVGVVMHLGYRADKDGAVFYKGVWKCAERFSFFI